MNTFASIPNVEFVRRRLLAMVESSALPLPNARRLALIESCRQAPDGAALLDMTLEALGDSVTIPTQVKDRLMDALMTGDWEGVSSMVTASATRAPTTIAAGDDPFCAFRRMAISIFYASRKIQQLSLPARRRLGSAILRTTTREELMHLFLTSLEHAQTLDGTARVKIANDVLEGRYYRLLLPDRFDCDGGGGGGVRTVTTQLSSSSLQRQPPPLDHDDGIRVTGSHASQQQQASSLLANDFDNDGAPTSVQIEHVWIDESTQECPICLGSFEYPTTLHCQHVFCRDCILDWAHQTNSAGGTTTTVRGGPLQPDVSCPICRQPNELPIAARDGASSSLPSAPPLRAYLQEWNIFNGSF